MSENKELLVSLDRIEEEIAVLVTREGHMWLLPADYLPEGSLEGDVFNVIIEKNREETEKLADSIQSLQQRLLDRTSERNKSDL